MTTHQLRLPESFSGEVRLFPLPDLVMFPSNVLPLHIFESRYREMLEDAMDGDQLITMATLEPGFESEYYTRPAVSPVVCIGRVTAHEKSEQGTYNLILVGLTRARVRHEIEPVRSFRRAKVTLLEDHCSAAEGERGRQLARELAERFRQMVPSAKRVVEEFQRGNLTLGALADVISFHLPFDTDLKLQLLGEVDVLQRVKKLLAHLPSGEIEPSDPSFYPPKFSDN